MEEEVANLRHLLRQREKEILHLKSELANTTIRVDTDSVPKSNLLQNGLSQNEISRYSRQLILPEIGSCGQCSLKQSSVLIVGAGGLGCPVGLYLAAAGIGKIGIVDHDNLDVSNMHRQIAHGMNKLGQNKSISLADTLKNINPLVEYFTYPFLLNSLNIEKIINEYDIVVDATDNLPTRYLLNDAAVLFKKCLISGSALRFEGQLTVYNYKNGPCYRCLFPEPPSPKAVTNCSDGGVIGTVTGVIGCLQAMEVVKIALGRDPSYFKKMLIFDGIDGTFRIIKLRNKKQDCDVCGVIPTITKLIDYELFCNVTASDTNISITLLEEKDRISCNDFKQLLDSNRDYILVDVRPYVEMSICSLPMSINIPLDELDKGDSIDKLNKLINERNSQNIFVICRRGNDSQRAVVLLRKKVENINWRDIKGGLHAWHDEIDRSFPKY